MIISRLSAPVASLTGLSSDWHEAAEVLAVSISASCSFVLLPLKGGRGYHGRSYAVTTSLWMPERGWFDGSWNGPPLPLANSLQAKSDQNQDTVAT